MRNRHRSILLCGCQPFPLKMTMTDHPLVGQIDAQGGFLIIATHSIRSLNMKVIIPSSSICFIIFPMHHLLFSAWLTFLHCHQERRSHGLIKAHLSSFTNQKDFIAWKHNVKWTANNSDSENRERESEKSKWISNDDEIESDKSFSVHLHSREEDNPFWSTYDMYDSVPVHIDRWSY